MAQRHGPWTIVKRTEVYRDPWMHLHRDEVQRPDGRPGSYAVLHLKSGVSVLALDDDQCVHLTQEFHYGVGQVTIEAVSGGIEPDEDPAEAAKRELREELGIRAGTWQQVAVIDPFTANVVSPTHLFIARQLEFGQSQPEGSELIHCVTVPLDQAVQWLLQGKITHAPTCLLLLLAERALK